MLVSILINNYNYGEFLREAIDSALNQTHSHVEVVVVDDGSTDDSREIISTYGDRIIPIFKENGGQMSAANTGFAASSGEIICFLDSDDVFLPEKAAAVVQAWKATPDAAVVYHQLQGINEREQQIGRPWPRAVWCGNIRRRVERSGGWWPHPTTSGLCFIRSFAECLLPGPTRPHNQFPDTYLAAPAAFAGPVVGLRVPLALSRFHEHNMSSLLRPSARDEVRHRQEKLQRSLAQYVAEFEQLERSLHQILAIPVSMSLDDHPVYQRLLRSTGHPVSLFKVLFTTLACPALPLSMRWREAVRSVVLSQW